mmetsp:Transcript_29544/g.60403  ORF Transcript_29544/g.60403 Transcript_29544/m.60403 type:complete len:229 (+) Transcript_29544:547-1233(+)
MEQLTSMASRMRPRVGAKIVPMCATSRLWRVTMRTYDHALKAARADSSPSSNAYFFTSKYFVDHTAHSDEVSERATSRPPSVGLSSSAPVWGLNAAASPIPSTPTKNVPKKLEMNSSEKSGGLNTPSPSEALCPSSELSKWLSSLSSVGPSPSSCLLASPPPPSSPLALYPMPPRGCDAPTKSSGASVAQRGSSCFGSIADSTSSICFLDLNMLNESAPRCFVEGGGW